MKTRRAIFSGLISRLASLTGRGSAGWMTIIGAAIVGVIILLTLLGPWISPYDPRAINVSPPPNPSPPSGNFPLGTNLLGQDMLSRILCGGSIMIQVALLSVLFCFVIGVPIGLLASYTGGALDKVVNLVMDSFYAYPGLVLAIAIAAMMGRVVINMALSIGVVYIPSYYRIVRSQVLTIKELPYAEAARATGARGRTILLRYVLPNVLPSIAVVATMNFADAILTAAGLTFVGLGIGIDVPDWGWDLSKGRELLPSGAWWVITFPGVMIVLLALGFTLIGEGLSELLNPRLEK
ncbi:MAG: ABC transporter permease [Candidatus Bathyarchaeota archaeon]|nr:ABC transporter permease [Candidatus Bathyarchaeota archaeon]